MEKNILKRMMTFKNEQKVSKQYQYWDSGMFTVSILIIKLKIDTKRKNFKIWILLEKEKVYFIS